MNCYHLQAFLKDGAENVFTATLSRAEAEHLEDVRWRVRNAEFKQEGADGDKEKVTFTKVHCAYEKAVAKHTGDLDKIAALKRASNLSVQALLPDGCQTIAVWALRRMVGGTKPLFRCFSKPCMRR
ncbi:hypothetical protein ABBQ32_000748 [Trebouxia sp. C0010 RCD-2024]